MPKSSWAPREIERHSYAPVNTVEFTLGSEKQGDVRERIDFPVASAIDKRESALRSRVAWPDASGRRTTSATTGALGTRPSRLVRARRILLKVLSIFLVGCTSTASDDERRRDFHGRRSCRSQRQSLVSARRVEHRDLHVPAVLPVSEVCERRGQCLAVSNHVDRDGCGDVFIRVRVLLLLRRLAWRPDRRCRAGSLLSSRRSLLAARMRAAVPGSELDPLHGQASCRCLCVVRTLADIRALRDQLLPACPNPEEELSSGWQRCPTFRRHVVILA